MRTFVATVSILILSGCTYAPLKIASNTCFGSTDATRYNRLLLNLHPDGSYAAELQGDIGMWGTANGTWIESPEGLSLEPKNQTGEEFLHRLKKINSWILIAQPISGKYDYKWDPMKKETCRPN
jgi:hypothetical protein